MDHSVHSLVYNGITANSRATYSTAVNRYKKFCQLYLLSPFPITSVNCIRFVAHLAKSGLVSSTIKVYLSGLRSWSIDLGLPLPEIYTPSLSQALKTLDRVHSPTQAPPILYTHLLAIMARAPFNRDNLMALAAMSLAYFACLRPSEYLYTRGVRSPPSRADVVFSPDGASLDFKVHRSKTNPKGFIVHVGCSSSPLCPVCLIKLVFDSIPASLSSPLFMTNRNLPLSYSYLTTKLHDLLSLIGLDPAPFSLHSLRAGAATTAAAAGCTEQEVQRLGRWSSLCYRRYIRPSRQAQAALAPKLALALSPNHFIS